ncbi:DUF5107 domain-containing protein [Chloroflexota bacterium]
MDSAKGTGGPVQRRWLGIGFRFVATLLVLFLLVMVNRCGTPTPTGALPTAHSAITAVPSVGAKPQEPAPTSTLIPLVTQSVTPTLPAQNLLPDLRVQQVKIELQTGGACNYQSNELGLSVIVENAGGLDAGPFKVSANDATREAASGLPAGERLSLWFPGFVPSSENVVTVDAGFQVDEIDEENNSFAQMVPVPTLPSTCTPPPDAPPTVTPTSPPEPEPTTDLAPKPVTVREGQVSIPTYPFADYTHQAWNSAFNMGYDVLDWGVYEGSGPTPVDVNYRTLIVENEYLTLVFAPELGGRILEVFYKPTGNRVTYRNPVIKPTRWGSPEQGWWLAAGGIEWCLPVEEHGYEWGVPWTVQVREDADGATVMLRDTAATDRLRAEIAVRLDAGTAAFTIRPRLENPSSTPLDVKYWTNAMLAPGGRNAPSPDLRFVLPDDVASVTVHSRGDEWLPGYNERMPWPVYQGVDLSRLGNWGQWLGVFEDPAVGGFVGVYDEGYDEGLVRLFPEDVARGAKAFALGWNQAIPSENWTDDGSGYVEMHGGLAPTFDDSQTLPAGDHIQWTETWYPLAGLGGLRYANQTIALNVSAGGNRAELALLAPRIWSGDVVLLLDGQERWRSAVSLVPGMPFRSRVALGDDAPPMARLTILLEEPGGVIEAEYSADLSLE